jgi:hypothetical protein
MAEIQKLNISELDFDTIKNNLKDYFGSQSEFSDHDFGGSAISVMLDVLAYNTYYNAYYVNMLASESFFDSAQLRDSVVSKASMLGYTPQSTTGAKANVQITVSPDDAPATVTVDKFTQFTSTVNGTSYVFCTSGSSTIVANSGAYVATGVELTQGVPLTFRYTANTANTDQKFLLPNANTDTDTLTVTIQESASDTNVSAYSEATDITTINSTSNIYFLSESTEGQFRVQFGDGVLGRKPVTGKIVLLEALISEGGEVNGANVFSASGTVGGYSATVVTSNAAAGGSDKETIESIKFNAPKTYETQNRAVTTDDYKKIVEGNVSGLDSVSVWGGQDNDTPAYGKVFISAKPTGATSLSTSQIGLIKAAVTSYNMVSVTPEVVDPDIIDLIFTTTVKYDSRLTSLASGAVAELVIDTIQDYKTNNLLKFGAAFRYSTLSTLIDSTETSVISNLTTLTAKKGLEPSITANNAYDISFNNPIFNPSATYEGAVTSSEFAFTDATGEARTSCFMDDLDGTLRIFFLSGSDKVILSNTAGTVAYSNGFISISSFKPDSFLGATLDFTITPAQNDLTPIRNQIFEIANTNISITMQDDTSTGTTTAAETTASTTTGTSTGSSTTY